MVSAVRRTVSVILVLGIPFGAVAVDKETKQQYESTAKLIGAKDYRGAKALLNMILEKEPKYSDTLYAAGFCEEALGNGDAALDLYYRSLKELDPDSNLHTKVSQRIAKLDAGRQYLLSVAKDMANHAKKKFRGRNERAYRIVMDTVAMIREEPTVMVYLSDLEEFNVYVGMGKFGKNGSLGWGDDASIVVGGKSAKKGLSMHPPSNGSSRVCYDVKGKWTWFLARTALNDSSYDRILSPITFRVLGDGKELWTSKPVQWRGDDNEDVNVNISGVRELRLEVDCSGSYGGPTPYGSIQG